MAPIAPTLACFATTPAASPTRLNEFNAELLIRLHERRGALYTTLQGRYCLRAAIVNHRTEAPTCR
jgi:hypothetical protein